MTNPLKTVRTYLVTRRQIREREADLNRERADYDTPSARMDMEAILARHTSHEAREIEAILRRHALNGMLRNHS